MGGGCVAKERKEIESVTEFEITFMFLINKNVSKLQIILMSLTFKAEKKVKKQERKREVDLQQEKRQNTLILELAT